MTQSLARAEAAEHMTTIADFKPLDRYAHGLADERPRVPWLGTISAGYKAVDGLPKAVRKNDERWIHLPPEDAVNAPGLVDLLAQGKGRWLDVALPFEDPHLFLQQRFERRSASRLEVFGDETQLTVLGPPASGAKPTARRRVHPGDAEWDTLSESCSVACSLFFVPARWNADGDPEMFFPDGLGVYRVRFTSRNTLREILASLGQLSVLTGGRISGLPLRLAVQFREVADGSGARREVPVWTLRFRPPQHLELTPASWQELKRKSLAEGELLRALPAPIEETEVEALEAIDPDLDPDNPALVALRHGPPADAKFYESAWFARVKDSLLDSDAARAQFIGTFTRGRTDSLAEFLSTATEGQAAALLVAAAESVAASTPPDVTAQRAKAYDHIFEEDDLVVAGDRLVKRSSGEVLEDSPNAQELTGPEPSRAVATATPPAGTSPASASPPSDSPLADKYRRNRELVRRARELGVAGFNPLKLGLGYDVVEGANLELEDRIARVEWELQEVARQKAQEGLR